MHDLKYYSNPFLSLLSYCQLPNSGVCHFSSGSQSPPNQCPSLWPLQISGLSSTSWQRTLSKTKTWSYHYSVQNPCMIFIGLQYKIQILWYDDRQALLSYSFYSPPSTSFINHLDLLKYRCGFTLWTPFFTVSADWSAFVHSMLSLEFFIFQIPVHTSLCLWNLLCLTLKYYFYIFVYFL